jgi:hypothetical protein
MIDAGTVPVVAGFQGYTRTGSLPRWDAGAALPRQHSGSGLHAEAVEIYTDVDGIMTPIRTSCPAPGCCGGELREVFQMADNGSGSSIQGRGNRHARQYSWWYAARWEREGER